MNIRSNFLFGVRSAWRVVLALVFSLSLAGIYTQEAQAATFTVSNLNNSGGGSLRAAITVANANPGADKITFSVSGTITLGSSLPDITDHLTIDGSGQSITISGNDRYRVLQMNSGVSLSLNRLSIINGYDSGDYGKGAGVLNNGGSLTVANSAFSGNIASYGGGIDNNGGTLTVTNSTFDRNYGKWGGSIYNYQGTLTVTNSTFDGNYSTWGGGIVNNQGTLTVTNSTFDGNAATWGGGIFSYKGTLSVTNSTFSANGAMGTAGYAGGIANDSSAFHLKNTILANSLSVREDCSSNVALSTDIHNLIETNDGCGTPVSSSDPKLGPLANNGGSTRTFALLSGSPAIDAGDDATCSAAPVNNKDQRGVARTYGTHCDIGAYELKKGSLTVRSLGTQDGYILESGENTNVGGTMNSTLTTFSLGDEAGDKQYRAILSFNTAALPDTAVITKVTLKIKRPATGYLVGNNNPFTWGLGLKVDMRKPFFGTTAGLVISDFQTVPGKSAIATFGATPAAYWYSAVLNASGRAYVNKTGTTQFRLRFYKDDNDDNAADYMKFYSGNYGTAAARPTLIVEYYIP